MKKNLKLKKLKDRIKIDNSYYDFFNINNIERFFDCKVSHLPICYKILLENLIRNFDQKIVKESDIENLVKKRIGSEIQFKPSRVLMQDYTGVPAVSDLAAMRDSLKKNKIDPNVINPLVPVSLVVDHSIIVDDFGSSKSIRKNISEEFKRNMERYQLLKWAQSSFKNFEVFPPGAGICHQINLEYLAEIVSQKEKTLYFDSVVGTDSHTTMVNALSVIGWGVGGIEAESVMLGESISMLIPDVLGVRLKGRLNEGITATDLVLFITEKLRKFGVVGKFVEFFGSGLKYLSLSERSTISNMAPEYGATCGIFPTDEETLRYLNITGRTKALINIVKKYAQIQGTWVEEDYEKIEYNNILEIDLNEIEPCVSGPKRPQDRVKLKDVKNIFLKQLSDKEEKELSDQEKNKLDHGSVCVAAITSCTNTSNPEVMLMAGLIAQKAVQLKINVPNWVKTSLAPGSQVVEEYLEKSNLLEPLNKLGFNIVGYGCTTCIGNSGPLDKKVEKEINERNLNVCSVISGNRNFEGRIHPLVKSNFLASPPLVVMYALAGKVNLQFEKDPISEKDYIFFKDLWPEDLKVKKIMETVLDKKIFTSKYSKISEGDENWKKIKTIKSETFNWSISSTYIKKPPFLDLKKQSYVLDNARPLLILGDSVTTDHISPAGVIKENSSAGEFLLNRQVSKANFNSFGSRRGNHEVMVRGTFANIRIKNRMVKEEGGFTLHHPSRKKGEIYDISKIYESENVPLVVIAGKEYGTGSSRDWAAKGTKLLGIRAVIAESFERIHRSNLVGMGVLPLEFSGVYLDELKLDGSEILDLGSIEAYIKKPNLKKQILIKYKNGRKINVDVNSRIDTWNEINFFKKDGILPYVLDKVSKQ